MSSFIAQSVTDSTLRSYVPAINKYVWWCGANGMDPSPAKVTANRLAEFLAHLAAHSQLSSSTLGVYRSAISSWYTRGTLSDALPPGQSTAVELVMEGITRARRDTEQAARAEKRAKEPPLTPLMFAALKRGCRDTGPEALILFAAAEVAIYGFLRPSEFLGQPGKREERALRWSQVTFFADEAGLRRVDFDLGNEPPHHFILKLGATKADQAGNNDPIVVAAAPAVKSLWAMRHWACARSPRPVFVFTQHEAPHAFLTEAALCRKLTEWGRRTRILLGEERIVGKSFRRGGAAGALAAGASVPELQAAGRWRSAAMPALYAGVSATQTASQAHRMQVSKRMAPAAPGGSR